MSSYCCVSPKPADHSHWESPFGNFSSISAPNDCLKQFVPVPRSDCHQIMGIVGVVSRRRDTRNGTFHYDVLFLIQAVGTENVSHPKPTGCASWPGQQPSPEQAALRS